MVRDDYPGVLEYIGLTKEQTDNLLAVVEGLFMKGCRDDLVADAVNDMLNDIHRMLRGDLNCHDVFEDEPWTLEAIEEFGNQTIPSIKVEDALGEHGMGMFEISRVLSKRLEFLADDTTRRRFGEAVTDLFRPAIAFARKTEKAPITERTHYIYAKGAAAEFLINKIFPDIDKIEKFIKL